MRQPGGGVCRLRTRIACYTSPEEGNVEQSLSYQARRALLQQTAPQYREASPSQKRTLVDAFVAATGYHRTYARWLLNHADEVQPTLRRPRPQQYGPEVQHALFLAWHAANRICAKRLIPFLPTLIEALERHEHLHLTEECRKQLLSMSAATADRLLSSQRKQSQRGLSTTRAGTLLKQQIPIRTFEEWKEARPGFLEADLVAHCGTDIEGGYLYTLDAHRRSHRVDGMSASAVPESGDGASSSPTGTRAVPFSDPGDRYRQRWRIHQRGIDRLLRARTDHLHARTPVSEKRSMFCGSAPLRRLVDRIE